jgi:hypothetical protein
VFNLNRKNFTDSTETANAESNAASAVSNCRNVSSPYNQLISNSLLSSANLSAVRRNKNECLGCSEQVSGSVANQKTDFTASDLLLRSDYCGRTSSGTSEKEREFCPVLRLGNRRGR